MNCFPGTGALPKINAKPPDPQPSPKAYGAANTPLACTIMGIELFGATHAVPIAVACFVAYICSGHNGIYLSQRIAVPKHPARAHTGTVTLRDARASRRSLSPSNAVKEHN